MKTQIVRFIEDGNIVATAIGEFDVVSDPGPVFWSGDWTSKPPSVFKNGLPTHGYGGAFVPAMLEKARKLGIKAEVVETGEWVSYDD